MTTTLNIEAIDEIIDDLKTEPTAFDMSSWVDLAAPGSACGTTCCIAGDAILNSIPTAIGKKRVARRICTEAMSWEAIVTRAAKLLGLPIVTEDDFYGATTADVPLFHMSEWPKYYSDLAEADYDHDADWYKLSDEAWAAVSAKRSRSQARAAVKLLEDMKAGTVKMGDEYEFINNDQRVWWERYATNA